jgi:patatin-related protein
MRNAGIPRTNLCDLPGGLASTIPLSSTVGRQAWVETRDYLKETTMSDNRPTEPEDTFREQELRIALVMNGGVSLAVWIGGVSQEINRLVRGESVYGRLCKTLSIRPRVDIISGTSAGGINGALLALAMSQGKSLEDLRDIWLDKGDILTLLRQPTQSDPPSLLDGDYFYKAMVEGFQKIHDSPGGSAQPADRVPIELTLTTTVLHGEVNNFPDDVGTLIRDVTHRGLIQFRRGADIQGDPFKDQEITLKLASAARATASFPGAFQPFYLPGKNEDLEVGGESVPCLLNHTNFNKDWEKGRYVVDGGVLDNSPLETAIDAVFRQRAEGEVRRVLGYVVPDPGYIPDPPPQKSSEIPTLVNTVLASLLSIPRVESISDQLRAIAEHNQKVSQQRDARLVVAQSLSWEQAREVAEAVFTAYQMRRKDTAVEHIVSSLAQGAARHKDASAQGVALGKRVRDRIADVLSTLPDVPVPWLPDKFEYEGATGQWRWGLFTLENVMDVVLDLLRRGISLVPAVRFETTESVWRELKQARRQAFDLVDKLAKLRGLDRGHWSERGEVLAPELARLELEKGVYTRELDEILNLEIRQWIAKLDSTFSAGEPIRPPAEFSKLAVRIGELFLNTVAILTRVLELDRAERWNKNFDELASLLKLFSPQEAELAAAVDTIDLAWSRLLTIEVVQYAFGADVTPDQYLELIQFSANVPSAFGGPDRLEQKLAGVQMAHFGAFYKRSWRINDWMFGRLDGADRIVRILLDPCRLARLFGADLAELGVSVEMTGSDRALELLREVVFSDMEHAADRGFLENRWKLRITAMKKELAYLDNQSDLPEQLSECAGMVLERLHLDILRRELPELADAVGDDELDGADPTSNGPKFVKRFHGMLCHGQSENGQKNRLESAPQLSAEQIVQLFKDARVGEERILKEVGTDRFTRTVTRSTAVMVSALAGKGSGFKWLRSVFATARAPLIAIDLLVHALMKKGRVFVSLYGMIMASAATILLSETLGDAEWSDSVKLISLGILVVGSGLLLRKNIKLMLTMGAVVLFIWLGYTLVQRCIGI